MEPTNTLSVISLVFGLIRLARLMRVEEDRKKRLPWDAAAAAAWVVPTRALDQVPADG